MIWSQIYGFILYIHHGFLGVRNCKQGAPGARSSNWKHFMAYLGAEMSSLTWKEMGWKRNPVDGWKIEPMGLKFIKLIKRKGWWLKMLKMLIIKFTQVFLCLVEWNMWNMEIPLMPFRSFYQKSFPASAWHVSHIKSLSFQYSTSISCDVWPFNIFKPIMFKSSKNSSPTGVKTSSPIEKIQAIPSSSSPCRSWFSISPSITMPSIFQRRNTRPLQAASPPASWRPASKGPTPWGEHAKALRQFFWGPTKTGGMSVPKIEIYEMDVNQIILWNYLWNLWNLQATRHENCLGARGSMKWPAGIPEKFIKHQRSTMSTCIHCHLIG